MNDDALIDPGDGKPVKWADYRGGFVPKSQHDDLTTRFNQGRDYLLAEARKIEDAWKALEARSRTPAAPSQPPADPMGRFKDLSLVDGPTLVEAYRALNEGTITPIQKAVIQQHQVLQRLTQEVEKLRGSVGGFSEERSSQQYEQQLQGALKNLDLGFDLNHQSLQSFQPFLRELAEDVYRSYDASDPNYAQEMPGILKSRLESLLKFAQAVNKLKVDAAKDERRRFLRPGGTVNPQGRPHYQHENGSQIARRLFGSLEADAT